MQCIDDGHILFGIEIRIKWFEKIFRSRVDLQSVQNKMDVALWDQFTRKVRIKRIHCFQNQNSILSEKEGKRIINMIQAISIYR